MTQSAAAVGSDDDEGKGKGMSKVFEDALAGCCCWRKRSKITSANVFHLPVFREGKGKKLKSENEVYIHHFHFNL